MAAHCVVLPCCVHAAVLCRRTAQRSALPVPAPGGACLNLGCTFHHPPPLPQPHLRVDAQQCPLTNPAHPPPNTNANTSSPHPSPTCPPPEQVDAEKRTLIKALPHTLVLHLKRFEFDYETFQRWKVGGRPTAAPSLLCPQPVLPAHAHVHAVPPAAPPHPCTAGQGSLRVPAAPRHVAVHGAGRRRAGRRGAPGELPCRGGPRGRRRAWWLGVLLYERV